LTLLSHRMSGVGYACAIGSALCNGSFAAVSKFAAVQKHPVHPIIFNLYVCVGVCLSSFLAFPFLQWNESFDKEGDGTVFVYEPLGVLAGLLLVLAFTFSFLAIPLVGLSIGQGVWGGTAIIVSVLWGIIAFSNTVDSVIGTVGAMVLLLLGVAGIAFCGEIAKCFTAQNDEVAKDLLDYESGSGEVYEAMDGEKGATQSSVFVRGMLFAATVGCAGGSILVPMHYVDAEGQGLVFVPSFGIGVGICSPVVTVLYFLIMREPLLSQELHLMQVLPYGILAGSIWNVGNVLSIPAISRIGYSVAYPLMQCALLVSGLWGIFAFKEIKGAAVWIFFVASAVLLGGAAILSQSVSS